MFISGLGVKTVCRDLGNMLWFGETAARGYAGTSGCPHCAQRVQAQGRDDLLEAKPQVDLQNPVVRKTY